MSNLKKRAVVYDFDNTLFHSPSREQGEPVYRNHTGSPWPHRGWWGRVETLLPPIVPDPITEAQFLRPTLDAFRQDRLCENTNVYLMTGRPVKMESRIRQILAAVNCNFDEYFYRGMPGVPYYEDTLDVKIYMIRHMILHPDLQVLEIWEDRKEHLERLYEVSKLWKNENLQKIIIHDVVAGENHEI